MPDQSPPARRRPTTAGAQSVNRPAARRTGAQRAAPARPAPEELEPELDGGGFTEAKLICTAGPKAGTEFPLSGDEELVVGRATDNAISIPDTSVSRKHCSVRRVEGGWAVSDLGSGNGTLVNGERIEGETLLGNGDVITIGDTELSFADVANATDRRPMPTRRPGVEGAAPARRSQAGRPDVRARLSRAGAPSVDPAKKRKMILIGGAAAVVIFGGLVAFKVMSGKAAEQEQAQLAMMEAQKQELRTVMQEGRDLVRQGKWTDAKARFEQIAEAAPGFPGVQDYLARANIEIPNQEQLAAAEQALSKNQIAAAAAALKKVSKDTQQFEKLRELNGKLEQRIDGRLDEAKALMNTGGEKDVRRAAYVQAQEITRDILEMDPEHRDAKAISESAEKQIAAVDYVPPPVQEKVRPPSDYVVDRYTSGDATGALAMADECAGKDRKCKTLGKDIRDAIGLNKRVEDLDARGLSRLLALDNEITRGGCSPICKAAGTRAATLFYKNCSAAKAAGQWGKAVEWCNKALKAKPGDPGAKAIVEEIRGKSKEEYLRCYQLAPTDPQEALPCFRGVMQMSTPGDETHTKAENWVSKLEKQ